ncbi:peptidase S8 [Candidatus Pacearchaeota archaeon]|nr:peptidase S8 [Candidatus Pacearchaeota archaeon]
MFKAPRHKYIKRSIRAISLFLIINFLFGCDFLGIPKYSIEITVNGPGNVKVIPEKKLYAKNDIVTFIAETSAGIAFSGWSGDVISKFPSFEYQISSDLNLIANFDNEHYVVTSKSVGDGSITIEPSKEYYAYNEIVTLQAYPEDGYEFLKWVGLIDSTKNPVFIPIQSALEAIAVFEEFPEYTLGGTWNSFNELDQFEYIETADESSRKLEIKVFEQIKSIQKKNEVERIIVKFRGSGLSEVSDYLYIQQFGNEIKRFVYKDSVLSIIEIHSTKKTNITEILSQLNDRDDVEYAEPDYIVKTTGLPNDILYNLQWNLAQLDAPLVWDVEQGDSTVIVAVVDTGVAESLSDFAGTYFASGYNFVSDNSNTYDDNGHGSHVSGTIAQTTNNNLGCAGLAYGVTIMPMKVLGSTGSGYTSDVAAGVIWAVDHGAKIINLSLSGGGFTQTMFDAVEYAYQEGAAVFAASGNDDGAVGYPAAYDEYVLAVGATRYDKSRSYYSNFGPELDIVAPGGDVTVDQNNDGYGDGILQQTITDGSDGYYFFQGTSMASPHVAALGALIKSHNDTYEPQDIYDVIIDTAEDLGASGRDDYYGHGIIQPLVALQSMTTIEEFSIFDFVARKYPSQPFSEKWLFQANTGAIHIDLTYKRDADRRLVLNLYDSDNNLVASSLDVISISGSKIDYEVSDDGGVFYIEVEGN